MSKLKRIKRDIKDIKEASGNPEAIIKCFTDGYCYEFAKMLYDWYPEGEIMFDSDNNHFVFKYCDRFWDIRGELDLTKEEIENFGTVFFM